MKKEKRLTSLSSTSGIAVVTAVLIMALVASVAGFMLWRSDIDIRRVSNMSSRAQADSLAKSAFEWADMYINEQIVKNSGGIGEHEPEAVPLFDPERGSIACSISDAQGKFNINNMVRNERPSKRNITAFKRLLTVLDLPPALAEAVVDWIDPNSATRPDGGEDSYYLGFKPPYIAPNMPLMEIDDLLWVKGFDKDIVDTLRPYATALPVTTRVNVNSALPITLMALIENLKYPDAEAMVNKSMVRRFKNLSEFRESLPQSVTSINELDFRVTGEYFVVEVESRQEKSRVKYEALIWMGQNNQATTMIWRKGR